MARFVIAVEISDEHMIRVNGASEEGAAYAALDKLRTALRVNSIATKQVIAEFDDAELVAQVFAHKK